MGRAQENPQGMMQYPRAVDPDRVGAGTRTNGEQLSEATFGRDSRAGSGGLVLSSHFGPPPDLLPNPARGQRSPSLSVDGPRARGRS